MIRINLVAGERRAAKAPGRTFQIGQKMTLAGSLILVLTAVLVGWRYWATRPAEAQLASDIASRASRRDAAGSRCLEAGRRLRSAAAEQLQQRVALIDELAQGQSAPVHMIDQISRSLPEMTWLTNLKQEGYDVTIEGRCMTLTALSDFVGNLEASRYFRRPVEIVSSEVVGGDEKEGPS